LVSPWMPNGTLNEYLASNHTDLTVLDRSRILEDVGAGLRYLHSFHVMHGDITGANILIDEGGHARLIDFGLSTMTQPIHGQSHLAVTSKHPGAIPYTAPELVLLDELHDLDSVEKADIYSFGCVMLQILSGRPPWSEIKSPRVEIRIVVMITKGRGPQCPDGNPAVTDSDWNFIQKCLQFEPEHRPSADEVLDFVMHRFHSPGNPAQFVVLASHPLTSFKILLVDRLTILPMMHRMISPELPRTVVPMTRIQLNIHPTVHHSTLITNWRL
ncbi:kinase-like domain-containing protein, partial [Suillus americanus]